MGILCCYGCNGDFQYLTPEKKKDLTPEKKKDLTPEKKQDLTPENKQQNKSKFFFEQQKPSNGYQKYKLKI